MKKTDMQTSYLIEIKADIASIKTSIKNIEDHGKRIRNLEIWRGIIIGYCSACSILFPIITTLVLNKLTL